MTKTMNRRMFLYGTGGAALALPFLPSVLTRSFASENEPSSPGKCFFSVGTDHGEVWGQNMYPDESVLTQQFNYAGRNVRYGSLAASPDANGNVVWSPMCTASAQVMTPNLAQKFNILRGVDIPYRIAHHSGGHLGNFAGTVGDVVGGLPSSAYAAPTIDQVMAYSPSFYSADDLAQRMTQRSFCIQRGQLSYNYASPVAKVGALVVQPGIRDNTELFNYLFNPASAYFGIDSLIVDRVKQSYDLLKAHPRLSKGDLQRLNQHVEQMFEVERKLQVSALLAESEHEVPGHACSIPNYNYNNFNCQGSTGSLYNHHSGDTMRHSHIFNAEYCDLITDIIALAFSSGTSRIATWHQALVFNDHLVGDWHGLVAHCGFGASVAQEYAVGYNQGTFEHVLVGLASKLDAITTADGSTLLDNSLLLQTSEGGQVTHHTGVVNYPVVMAGGAGGFFNTGMFVDFGDKTKVYDDLDDVLSEKPGLIPESPGLYYNQFLANALLSMGIPKEEWEHFAEFTSDGPEKSNKTPGYGFHYVDPNRAADYAQAKLVMSDKLPVITS